MGLAGDYSYFVKCWDTPRDGIRGFLLRFLASKDEIDLHIAIWTLTQLLQSNGTPKLLHPTNPFHVCNKLMCLETAKS